MERVPVDEVGDYLPEQQDKNENIDGFRGNHRDAL